MALLAELLAKRKKEQPSTAPPTPSQPSTAPPTPSQPQPPPTPSQPQPPPTPSQPQQNTAPRPRRTPLDVAKYFRNAYKAGAFDGLVQPSLPELEQTITKACGGDKASLERILELAEHPGILRLLRRASARLAQHQGMTPPQATPTPSEPSTTPTPSQPQRKHPHPVYSLPHGWLYALEKLLNSHTLDLPRPEQEQLRTLIDAAHGGDSTAEGTLEFIAYKWHAEGLL